MKKHKPTWVDGLVIALILLLIAGTCLRFLVLDSSVTGEDVTFSYVLQISGIRQVTVDSLQVGDTVYDDSGKGAVGVISDISVTQATTTYTNDDGTISEAEIEDRYTVYLTVTASGTVTNGSYEIGTYDIQVNSSNTYFTKYSIWSATVWSIGNT